MSCCNCCQNTLNLGCINSCGATFITGIIADSYTAGIWILQLTFGNVVIKYEQKFNDNDFVIFEMPNLNENYTYTAQIFMPSGQLVTFQPDNIIYDCIEFSTKVGLSNNVLK